MVSNLNNGLKEALSSFGASPQATYQGSIDAFLKKLASGIAVSGLPLEFVVEQLSLIPARYKRLKTSDLNTVYSNETGIFTPFSLVDHLALAHYNGFNLFDLLDETKAHTHLRIGNEDFIFILMTNIPVANLGSGEARNRFEYRLAIWTDKGTLVGFRNHYVEQGTVQGYKRKIDVNFHGQSGELGLVFEKPTDDGIWVNPYYRRRHIGETLEAIASGFIPAEMLDVKQVLVYPGDQASKDFYWEIGYDDAADWIKQTSNLFPKIGVLPKDKLGKPVEPGMELDEKYSPTWQYASFLNAGQR